MAERIGVVMPVRDNARFIGAALDSVLAQTETSWELIVSDDGSTDGTSTIVESYVASDPRITAISGPNGGAAVARNRGIAATDSRSRYVVLLDSDDILTSPVG